MIIKSTIYCPYCGHRHIDRNEWGTKPHHTHLCTEDDGGRGSLFRLTDPTNEEVYFAGVPVTMDKTTRLIKEIN